MFLDRVSKTSIHQEACEKVIIKEPKVKRGKFIRREIERLKNLWKGR